MKSTGMWIRRFGVLLTVLVGIAAMITTVTVAKYLKKTDEVENSFSPAVAENPPIKEDFDGETKEHVYFEVNPGNNPTEYPVYFRVAIVITWKDKDGVVYYSVPEENKDYTLSLNLGTKDQIYGGIWTLNEDDGYYYYDIPVESGGRTSELINYCAPVNTANPPEGCTLSVEIIVQTVQAVGMTDDDNYQAWQDAWENAETAPSP